MALKTDAARKAVSTLSEALGRSLNTPGTNVARTVGERLQDAGTMFSRRARAQVEGLTRKSAIDAPHLAPGQQTLREALGILARHPVKAVRQNFNEMHPLSKLLMVGAGGHGILSALTGPKEARGKNFGSALGSAIGWPALNRVPVIPGIAGMLGLSTLGGAIGQYAGGTVPQRARVVPDEAIPYTQFPTQL